MSLPALAAPIPGGWALPSTLAPDRDPPELLPHPPHPHKPTCGDGRSSSAPPAGCRPHPAVITLHAPADALPVGPSHSPAQACCAPIKSAPHAHAPPLLAEAAEVLPPPPHAHWLPPAQRRLPQLAVLSPSSSTPAIPCLQKMDCWQNQSWDWVV